MTEPSGSFTLEVESTGWAAAVLRSAAEAACHASYEETLYDKGRERLVLRFPHEAGFRGLRARLKKGPPDGDRTTHRSIHHTTALGDLERAADRAGVECDK